MKNPKIIVMYLPQFHEIPENNLWWGKGFTEWTNTKKSTPLFKGHYQPKVPYQKNYYNLLDTKTREWQARLAKEYGIYGFCYYHYWFKGKKLLEKPAELMLKSKKPNFPFCFSWANHSWVRNQYSSKRETLLKQEYGDKKDWMAHFKYLSKFFKDKRYIKVDNKPVFILYKSYQIDNLDAMIKYWNYLAIKEGFSGVHIVETYSGTQSKTYSKLSEGIMFYEPGYTLAEVSLYKNLLIKILMRINNIIESKYLLHKVDYDKVYKKIIDRNLDYLGRKVYLGSFVNFDDTARRKYRAHIFENVTSKKFENYLTLLLKKSRKKGSEFLFINAWNEWAEGAYLEPDEKNKYDFIKAIKNAQNNKNLKK
jgi:hypothetical protein